jgi:hypothetical protein
MRWKPPSGSVREQAVAKRLRASSKFYRFLWEIRGELFADGFEEELIKAYQPRGQDPCPPALVAMVMLLQRYEGLSDADAVDAAENDRRWQLVLGTLGEEKAPFGQGTLVRFRVRATEHDLDKKLVDRTVELGKKSGKFGWQRLRAALDSSPLHGAGRVEDTWNLIGRAMAKVVRAVSLALEIDEEVLVQEARLSVLEAESIKAALDIDWDDEDAQQSALKKLLDEVSRLEAWVARRAKKQTQEPPLKDALELLRRVVDQDTEPDPSGGRGPRIKQGVANDRIISLGDTEMRHGRKSRSKRFDGYKRHIAIANGLILATAVEAANAPEHVPAARLLDRVARHGEIEVLDIDRGYLASSAVEALHRAGVTIHSRAWQTNGQGLFIKEDFDIDLDGQRIICPAGTVAALKPSGPTLFSSDDCGKCFLKPLCTNAARRSVTVHRQEDLLIQLRARRRTRPGRRELRRRVAVEHSLARIGSIQGQRARYRGARKNELDLNRAAALANLHALAHLRAAA